MGFSDFVLHSRVNLVFRLVRLFQSVLLHLLFSFGEIKPMFGFQLLADLFVTVHIIPVRNSLTVVIYTVEHDMHVRMLTVLMAHDNILRIGDL